jgi:hypothetical protein
LDAAHRLLKGGPNPIQECIMKSLTSLFVVTAFVLAGCSGAPGSDEPTQETAADTSDLKGGVTLRNGADRTIGNAPDTLKISVAAADAQATITDSNLATCTVKVNEAASTPRKTVFDFTGDYQIDSGWNGCTIEFSATGYKATLMVGIVVDD